MKILEKDYELKYNLRSMFIVEEITGKPFKIETMFDTYILCYACILAGGKGITLDFNDFIDYCDEHPEVIEEFNEFMNDELKKRELSDKKKVTENN